MRDRIWPFVVGNNLFPIVLIGAAVIVYFTIARGPEPAPSKESTPTPAIVPKYVEKIIERHHYLPAPGDWRIHFLPKAELERERPGSVAPAVLADNNAQVVARTELEPSKYRTQVDAIRTEDPVRKTVDFRLDVRSLPRKWYDLKREWHAGLYYGVSGENILEADASLKPLRLGPVETVVRGRIGFSRSDSSFNGALLVGVEY